MSDEHQHPPGGEPHHHPPAGGAAPDPQLPEDAGSKALADALRSSFIIVQVLMVGLVALFLMSGFFTVGPQERGVIMRLGKTVGAGNAALLGPGMHWAFPPPIDEVKKIPYAQSLTIRSTVGWYYETETEAADEATTGRRPAGRGTLNPLVDGYTLVGDGNIIHARATLSFRVEDPIRYAFDFVNASNSVQNALDNSLIYASARFTNVDDVLRRQRALFQDTVRNRMENLVDQQGLGIAVEQCTVDDLPPLTLTADFEKVTSALSRVAQLTNQAASDALQATNVAATEAIRIVNAAETERRQMITNLEADVKLFKELEPLYRTNSALVERVYLTPAIARAMSNVAWKWYIPTVPGGPIEVRIQTGPNPPAPRAPAPPGDSQIPLD